MLDLIEQSPDVQEQISSSNGIHALVVDDEPISLEVVSQQLKLQNIKVTKSNNGDDALNIIHKGFHPDVVLLDVVMPGKNGIEVCKEIRKLYSSNELPIIMLTGQEQVSDIVKGLEAGANDYLTKPVSNNELIARLRTHLHIANLSKSLKQANERVEKQKRELEIRNVFIKKTFGRYLSDDIVESILETPEGLKLGGEKRNVTILMSDLRGFTSIGEGLQAEEVLFILNNYLEKMTDIIFKYEGTIDEIIGDAILVIFGAPFTKSDDACRAIACALEMQIAMDEVNANNKKMNYPELSMGIGINTGEVIVGNIGSSRRAKYGVIGSNVNLTSRIESYTLGGQILISEQTKNECKEKLRIDKKLNVSPKGLKESITIYEIGGIIGDCDICLPSKTNISCKPLSKPLKIIFSVIEGKDAGDTEYEGKIIAMSNQKYIVSSSFIPAPLSNVKMILFDQNDVKICSEIYGKLDDGSTSTEIYTFIANITYMPPGIDIKY
ncbi:adenylate/guanylate cyclase [Candidatus Magnetomorum sp. HK-1]|nr:adenylate/guanylate cyclase [Candidatus Magnetomorum sp. HK-1]